MSITDAQVEAAEVVKRLRYSASPDQNGYRVPHSELLLDAANSIDALRAALAAAQGEGVEWQPIETAPKNRWILGWAPQWNVVDMAWLEIQEYGIPGHWSQGTSKPVPATHWRPLPDPPDTRALRPPAAPVARHRPPGAEPIPGDFDHRSASAPAGAPDMAKIGLAVSAALAFGGSYREKHDAVMTLISGAIASAGAQPSEKESK